VRYLFGDLSAGGRGGWLRPVGGRTHFGSLTVEVTAEPTCPVERIGDPACAPRPMKGAHLRLDGAGEITLVTDASGTARDDQIPVRAYRLVPQSVTGLMGIPAPVHIVIRQEVKVATCKFIDRRSRQRSAGGGPSSRWHDRPKS
jgi:hypothetical protein